MSSHSILWGSTMFAVIWGLKYPSSIGFGIATVPQTWHSSLLGPARTLIIWCRPMSSFRSIGIYTTHSLWGSLASWQGRRLVTGADVFCATWYVDIDSPFYLVH